jgi:hypothetical protein
MPIEILLHTPKWVYLVFALLLWFGAKQLVANTLSLGRAALMPFAMTALSLSGVTSAFGDSPVALLAWAAGALVLVVLVQQRALPAATRYDAATRRFHVAGSAVPLLLMMGIFFTKYAVGVSLALHPGIRHDHMFAIVMPLVYGAFSGIFAGRALRLWRLAIRADRALAGAGGA